MKYFIIICVLIFIPLLMMAQGTAQQAREETIVVILTNDGSEIIGVIVSETDNNYSVKTPAGISIDIPKAVVISVNKFSGKVKGGKITHADPNKSMYLFAPSAFPIGNRNGYCRDFCIFFPSINYGVGNLFSLQGGVFWFPGMRPQDMPIVGSVKATIISLNKLTFAGGIMYIKFPTFNTNISTGAGFSFVTGTFGNQFSHVSISGGWGFIQIDDEWNTMDRPILVLAGNKRISNSLALITENWIFPDTEIDNAMLSVSTRYFGRKIAVDVGAVFSLVTLEDTVLFPILNFTYHFSKK